MTDLLHSMSLGVVDAAGRVVPVDDQRRAMMLRTVGLHRIVRRDCDETQSKVLQQKGGRGGHLCVPLPTFSPPTTPRLPADFEN